MSRVVAAIHPKFRVRLFVGTSIGLGAWCRRRVFSVSIGPFAVYVDWSAKDDPYEVVAIIETGGGWRHQLRGLSSDELSLVWMLAEAGVPVRTGIGWWYS